jgi:hypothetical protein
MIEIRPVGIYAELYENPRRELPSIRSSFSDRSIRDRSKGLEYLHKVLPVFDVLDVTTDVLDGTKTIRSGSSLITDGSWVWRKDSIHYLTHYPLDIDDEFLEHVRAHNHTSPPGVSVTDELLNDHILKYF